MIFSELYLKQLVFVFLLESYRSWSVVDFCKTIKRAKNVVGLGFCGLSIFWNRMITPVQCMSL